MHILRRLLGRLFGPRDAEDESRRRIEQLHRTLDAFEERYISVRADVFRRKVRR